MLGCLHSGLKFIIKIYKYTIKYQWNIKDGFCCSFSLKRSVVRRKNWQHTNNKSSKLWGTYFVESNYLVRPDAVLKLWHLKLYPIYFNFYLKIRKAYITFKWIFSDRSVTQKRNHLFNLFFLKCYGFTSEMKQKHLRKILLTCNTKNNNTVFGDLVSEYTPRYS